MRRTGRNLLVTGGAGYIGSHVTRLLVENGDQVTVYDNLSSGHAWAVLPGAELVVGDLGDRERLVALFAGRRFDAVLHFAALIDVAESVREPAKYYRNNVAYAIGLFELAAQHGVGRVVFSSTAAVYGEPARELIDEAAPLAPINPYGASKMMAERILTDIAAASSQRYAILRYFNVAGADPEGRIGQATLGSRHLIKVASETALGLRRAMRINGTDYPTLDGTCVRDFIHVDDLARAHLAALDYLDANSDSVVLNCGYGRGASVRAVLDTVRRVSGVDFPIESGPRRPGDPAALVADSARIRHVLGWQPRHDDLEFIIRTAWAWEKQRRTWPGGAPPR